MPNQERDRMSAMANRRRVNGLVFLAGALVAFLSPLYLGVEVAEACACGDAITNPLCACGGTGVLDAQFGSIGQTCNAQRISSAESCCGTDLIGSDLVSMGLMMVNTAVHCSDGKSFFCPFSGASTVTYATKADCKTAMTFDHVANSIAACQIYNDAGGSWSPWFTSPCASCPVDPGFCGPTSCTCTCVGF
jgi:hypothetical protein